MPSDCPKLIAATALFGVKLGGLVQKRQPYCPKLTSNLGFLDSFSQSEAAVGLLSEKGLVLHGALASLSSTMRFFPCCSIDPGRRHTCGTVLPALLELRKRLKEIARACLDELDAVDRTKHSAPSPKT